ncbi:protein trunk-like [Armigeres subalbatus]|uniref:protein trunk-like n=1 Tax=Armigeres subalbatus TaxID=124917 RepID=UPI002ED1A5BE
MHVSLTLLILLIFQDTISSEPILSYLTNRRPKNCAELSPPILSSILGPAFNSRYMSIDKPPVMDDEPAHGESDGKRYATNGLFPEFYVDDDYTEELGNKPAWLVDHVNTPPTVIGFTYTNDHASKDTIFKSLYLSPFRLFGRHGRRSVKLTNNHVLRAPLSKRDANGSKLANRSTRNARRGQKSSGSSRPWNCEAKIRWMDLGDEYYPRFLRTVECAKTSCWYGHYQCTPRSFTIKILRKRPGECVPIDETHKIGIEGLPAELSELWVWEERAVNFCCDCAPRF